MTPHDRYQRLAKRADQGHVVSWSGVDAVTGLPVLVYDIAGRPRRAAERLESDHIPAVLASSFDGRRGELVVAFATDDRSVQPDDVTEAMVLSAARALRDAGRIGVVHGDLRPERFRIAGGRLVVEGYGVPWQPADAAFVAPEIAGDSPSGPSAPASLSADVYAFGATFIAWCRGRVGAELLATLAAAMAPDPRDRPDAATLLVALERAAAPIADAEPLVIDSDSGETLLETSRSKRPPRERNNERNNERNKRTTGSFSKDPPPGTRYRSGHQTPALEPGRFRFPSLHDGRIVAASPWRWYRFAMLGATLILVAILAFLALSSQADRLGDPTATRAVVYVVDVVVEPASLPPVRLFVVEAPDASKWQPGTELGNVPGRVVLDREGTWQFQGRFQDRLSQIATIELPAQRLVTLAFTPTQSVRQP